MRTFKHEKTGNVATEDILQQEATNGYVKTYLIDTDDPFVSYRVPAWMIEDQSCEWAEIIQKDYEILEWDGVLWDNPVITKVKRLSDGEVFSVSDEVEVKKYPFVHGKVIKIVEEEGQIKLYHTRNGDGFSYLHEIQKTRKPILKTEDGVELFEEDKHYWIDDMDIGEDPTDKSDPRKGYKYFSTREAAEKYRFWNYRGLSLNDVREVIYSTDVCHASAVDSDLEDLVKSRL